MTHNYDKPGPMTQDEMQEWMSGKQNRRVNDLCLVAWGYHPESSAGKAYNFNEHGGIPERIRNGIFTARNHGEIWAEKFDGDEFFRMDRNKFAEWLQSQPSWQSEKPCRLFINAWRAYQGITEYPDTIPRGQSERIRRAIDAVRAISGVAEVNAAARLILEGGQYKKFQEFIISSRGKNKGKLMKVEDIASAYSAKPRAKSS